MSETVTFVVVFLAVIIVFGILGRLTLRAFIRVERAALADLNAPLVVSDDRRLDAALRDAQSGYKVCPACGFENFKRFQYCAICGEALVETVSADEHEDGGVAKQKKKSPLLSCLSSLSRHGDPDGMSTPLSAPSRKATRRLLRAQRRKEWTRKVDVERRVYWFHGDGFTSGDTYSEGFAVKFDASGVEAGSEENHVLLNNDSRAQATGLRPADGSVEERIAQLLRDTQGVCAKITAVSDSSVDASEMPLEIEMGPRLNALSVPLTETITLSSKEFPSKYTHFVMTASSLLVPAERGHMRLTLERANMFEDSMKTLAIIPRKNLRSALRISFLGETGVDAGGLHREWFVLLNEMLVDPARGLFVCTDKSEQSYFLTPSCSSPDILPQQLLQLFATGRLLDRALLEGSMLCFHLAAPLLKLILGYPLGFKDLEDLDPEMYKSLCWLLENDNVDALGLDFSATMKDADVYQAVELVPNGGTIDVTDTNKREYVKRKWKYLLVESVAPQLQVFLRGLYEIIPRDLLLLFDPEEFDFLLCGSDEIDVDDWERNTNYSNELHHHRARKLFWELVREMPNEYRRRLLQFSTGSSRVPLGGFSALTSYDGRLCPFMLKAVPLEGGGYIRSHACFNRLDLPLHFEREKMRTMLNSMLDTEVYGFTMD